MPRLLIATAPPDERLPITRTGGRPLLPEGMDWPCCGECSEPMQFLAQVALRDADDAFPERLLLVFMCNSANDCTTWEHDSGASLAFAVPCVALSIMDPPADPTRIVRDVDGVSFEAYEAASTDSWTGEAYDRARSAFPGRRRDVLGHVGGPICCVNLDEGPTCPACSVEMRFVVQLEEGRYHETVMNFGGGSAFAFVCPACWSRGAFLWEQ